MANKANAATKRAPAFILIDCLRDIYNEERARYFYSSRSTVPDGKSQQLGAAEGKSDQNYRIREIVGKFKDECRVKQ